MPKIIFTKKTVNIFCMIVTLLCLSAIISFSLSASPIADDWGFKTMSDQKNLFDMLADCYQFHTGRIGQWFLIFSGYKIFGMKAIQVAPVLMIFALSALFSKLLQVSNCFDFKDFKSSLPLGSLLAATFILLLPSIHDSFLWYDSSLSYITSVIASLVLFIVLFSDFKNRGLKIIALITIGFFAQTFNEITAILNIIVVFFLLANSVYKKDNKKVIIYAVCLAALFGGLLFIYFSPGSIARRIDIKASHSISWVFIDSLKNFATIAKTWNIWKIILLFILAIAIKNNIKKQIMVKKTAFIMFGWLAVSTYMMFCINNYCQDYMPYRALTVPVLGLVTSVAFFVAFFTRNIKTEQVLNKKWALVVVSIVLSCGFIYGIRDNTITIRKLSMRKQLLYYRDAYTKEQINSGKDTIDLIEAPNLLTGNAEDFYYYNDENGEKKIIWVAQNYQDYIGASDKKIELIGAPDFYYLQ